MTNSWTLLIATVTLMTWPSRLIFSGSFALVLLPKQVRTKYVLSQCRIKMNHVAN